MSEKELPAQIEPPSKPQETLEMRLVGTLVNINSRLERFIQIADTDTGRDGLGIDRTDMTPQELGMKIYDLLMETFNPTFLRMFSEEQETQVQEAYVDLNEAYTIAMEPKNNMGGEAQENAMSQISRELRAAAAIMKEVYDAQPRKTLADFGRE